MSLISCVSISRTPNSGKDGHSTNRADSFVFFDYPERIGAHETKDFTAALNKFTIPDKKKLVIEMQEREGGRHFLYKLDNKPIISAEILNPKRKSGTGKMDFPVRNNP